MKPWEANIRRVTPYVPGEQPKEEGIIKLNTNENPYPPSPKVTKALKEMNTDLLRKYPDSACNPLVEKLAEAYGLSADRVFAGVGSDDVLAMCFMTFFNAPEPILFPDITYSFYDVWSELLRIPFRRIPIDIKFGICPEDYNVPCGGVILPNPNAPTGRLLPLSDVEKIIRQNRDCIVIVDEAYIDFGGESTLPLLDRYDNLVVVQTFSKSRSLAGMRIGAAFSSPELIRYLNDVKYSFNSYTLNTPALAAGTAALSDEAYYRDTTSRIMRTRERTAQRLRELGFVFEESAANFLFVTHPGVKAQQLFDTLKQSGIYVRHFKKPERIDNYLRITIGTDEEMDRLFSVLEQIPGLKTD